MFPLTSASTLQEARSIITHLNLAFLGGKLSPPGSEKPERGSSDGDLDAASRHLMRAIEDMDTEPILRYRDKRTQFAPREILSCTRKGFFILTVFSLKQGGMLRDALGCLSLEIYKTFLGAAMKDLM